MSGPKVVRIVSREEVVAICEGLLAQLDAAHQEWLRVGRRNGLLSDGEVATVEARHAQTKALLKRNRFLDVQKAVPGEIAALRDDQERRLARAAAEAAAARAAERRVSAVAVSVLAALAAAGTAVPPELRRELGDAAAGGANGGGAIARGFALLGQGAAPAVTQDQRALAAALKDGNDRLSVEEWLAKQPASADEKAFIKLDRHVATLRGLGRGDDADSFEARLGELVRSASSSARAIRLDSLELDLARAVTEARARASVQARLRGIAAELALLGSDAATREAAAVLAGLEESVEALMKQEVHASAVLEQAKKEIAARGRRRAVLEGLAGLGYQVSEQMETAWVENGRVVLKKTSQPGYGVEIGGGADAARVQMRTVAFRGASDPADPARDRDAETIWCGDLDRLRTRFAEGGGEIAIETALGVGKVPLRVVTEIGANPLEQGRQATGPRNRTLRNPPG